MTFHPMSKVDGQCPNCRAVEITMDGALLIAIDWSKVKFVSGVDYHRRRYEAGGENRGRTRG